MNKKKERRTWEERHEIWNEVAEEYGMTGEELRKAAMPWPAGAIEKGLLDEEDLRKALKNKGYEPKDEMDRNEDPRDKAEYDIEARINKAYNFQDPREAIFRRNNPTEEEKRMNLEAGWYSTKESSFKTEPMRKWAQKLKEQELEEISEYAKNAKKDEGDQIDKQNNQNSHMEDAEERMNKHIEKVNKQKRMERNTAEHGPILAKFIEDGREHEAEQIKENVKKMMKRGMLSKEDEKEFMEKFGTFKKLYEAPTVTLIDEKTLDPIDIEPDSIDQVNYVGTGEEPEGLPVITLREYSFDDILWKLREIHARKNHDYGNAAHESYKEFGFISYVIRLNDKLKRLKSLTKPGAEQQVKEESIIDTLMDLAAYSIMAIESLKSE